VEAKRQAELKADEDDADQEAAIALAAATTGNRRGGERQLCI
jgi:hypothetical protein